MSLKDTYLIISLRNGSGCDIIEVKKGGIVCSEG